MLDIDLMTSDSRMGFNKELTKIKLKKNQNLPAVNWIASILTCRNYCTEYNQKSNCISMV